MSSVEIHQWVTRSQELLEQVASAVEEAPIPRVRSLAGRLPKNVTPDEGAVSVVFAGQYSAGKSSILKAMTGRDDINVGAGIVTRQACYYDWNGISIVDTPGIHTEIRPDHDAAAYEAISEADLLVFVVTNELFDSYLADHFRKLAVEQGKAHEMMLVVNKMRRCAEGNTNVAQAVIREDLRKVLAPFSPEELHTSFVDAQAEIDADLEVDPDVARFLRSKSGFASFTNSLNEFVREQGFASRYTTALYTVEQVLQEALIAEPPDDLDVEALMELLVQQRHALVDGRRQLSRSIDDLVQKTLANVRSDGRKIADLIHASADWEEVDRRLRNAQAGVEKRAKALEADVQKVIERDMAALGDRVAQIVEGAVAKDLFSRFTFRFENVGLDEPRADPEALADGRKASDVTKQLGQFLTEHSFNPKSGSFAGLFKLDQYSGTRVHDSVKAMGNYLGKSFKPWEAVKWTRRIANVGRVLTVVGTVVNIALQIKEDVDAAKQEAELRGSREAVRAGFGDSAHAIETQFDQVTNECISQLIGQPLEEVDLQLEGLHDMQRTRGDFSQDLMRALDATRTLIREMHGENAKAE